MHREALPLTRVPGADADDMQLDEHEAAQPDELMQQELLSNDEAHDQLMDLPFAHGAWRAQRVSASGVAVGQVQPSNLAQQPCVPSSPPATSLAAAGCMQLDARCTQC